MILKDYHIHTTYSDGKNTPEEMILSAIEKGFTEIGFSDHSYTDFDLSYCMKADQKEAYVKEINELKEKYSGTINVLCGIEQDYYSTVSTKSYDYVIGSVHYVKSGETYVDVDHSRDKLIEDVNEYFEGSFESFYRAYYKNVADVAAKTECDIIGHFDLVAKFNESGDLFDENSSSYEDAWREAADILLKADKPFEINMGAITRGYRSTPYPSNKIYEYLKKNGAKFILSSDSHSQDSIGAYFDKYEELVR